MECPASRYTDRARIIESLLEQADISEQAALDFCRLARALHRMGVDSEEQLLEAERLAELAILAAERARQTMWAALQRADQCL